MSKRIIYMDNAATTRPYDEVTDVVVTYMRDNFGNPGGNYAMGGVAKDAVRLSRHLIANILGAKDKDIYFTAGGSEADNLAIKGVCEKFKTGHIVTTAVEHKAVLKACAWAEEHGFKVTYLDPDERGYITPQQVENALRDDTILVSCMMVNNEVGTVYPIAEIGKICRKHKVLFHVDAVQAFGHMPIDVKEMKIDMLSASGHKFHGPKGVGFLYSNTTLPPLISGGSQERGMRAGTENVPGIVGMGLAAKMSYDNLEDKMIYVADLRDHMIDRILREIPGSRLNGTLLNRCANNVNIRLDKISGEALLVMLDLNGICASTGSACNSADGKPSHVLTAMGLTDVEAKGSLRFTLDEFTTIDDVNECVDMLKMCVEQLRGIS